MIANFNILNPLVDNQTARNMKSAQIITKHDDENIHVLKQSQQYASGVHHHSTLGLSGAIQKMRKSPRNRQISRVRAMFDNISSPVGVRIGRQPKGRAEGTIRAQLE